MTLSNYRFAIANGLIYLSDIDLSKNRIAHPDKSHLGFHASGHGSDEFLITVISDIAQGGNLKGILPVHTQFRGKYSQKILNELRRQKISFYPNETKIMSRIRKPRFEIPLF